jgi:flagellar assembly protein FliH
LELGRGGVEKQRGAERIRPFEYPACAHAQSTPTSQFWEEEAGLNPSAEHGGGAAKMPREPAANSEFDQRLAEETRRAFEAGRERGRQAEHEAQAAALKAAEQRYAGQGAELIASFVQERDRYLHSVEQEVVKLALAIAARILRREAQMDPLLLTGAVRVALGQLSGSTEVRLRVPPAELDLWTEAIALLPNLSLKPIVTPGEGMRLGNCVIETSLGSVDLGLRAQLVEIERGFFDRAAAAPAAARATEIAAERMG